jgi:hypothetical protein
VQPAGGPPEVELIGQDREVAQVPGQVDAPDDTDSAIARTVTLVLDDRPARLFS